jgi:hypothetical protein
MILLFLLSLTAGTCCIASGVSVHRKGGKKVAFMSYVIGAANLFCAAYHMMKIIL